MIETPHKTPYSKQLTLTIGMLAVLSFTSCSVATKREETTTYTPIKIQETRACKSQKIPEIQNLENALQATDRIGLSLAYQDLTDPQLVMPYKEAYLNYEQAVKHDKNGDVNFTEYQEKKNLYETNSLKVPGKKGLTLSMPIVCAELEYNLAKNKVNEGYQKTKLILEQCKEGTSDYHIISTLQEELTSLGNSTQSKLTKTNEGHEYCKKIFVQENPHIEKKLGKVYQE